MIQVSKGGLGQSNAEKWIMKSCLKVAIKDIRNYRTNFVKQSTPNVLLLVLSVAGVISLEATFIHISWWEEAGPSN